MNVIKLLACAAALSLAPAGFAAADENTGLRVKVGVAGVLPDESAEIDVIGGDAEISDEAVPALILDYAFTDRISAQLFCCLARHEGKAIETAAGTVDLGEITLFPPILSLTYKVINKGWVQPYIGAGINYTHFFNDELPANSIAQTIRYDDSVGPAVVIGADFPITERLFINLDIKKAWIETDVTINGTLGAEIEINPIIAFGGIGYKF